MGNMYILCNLHISHFLDDLRSYPCHNSIAHALLHHPSHDHGRLELQTHNCGGVNMQRIRVGRPHLVLRQRHIDQGKLAGSKKN